MLHVTEESSDGRRQAELYTKVKECWSESNEHEHGFTCDRATLVKLK